MLLYVVILHKKENIIHLENQVYLVKTGGPVFSSIILNLSRESPKTSPKQELKLLIL